MTWNKVFGGPPWLDWNDAGKRIRLRRANGEESVATLFYEDWGVDGDGDEFPYWRVRFTDGSDASIHDFEEWKFEA